MDKEKIRERCGEMTDRDLVMWTSVFEHMAQMEFRLAGLEASFAPGRRVPGQDVADIGNYLQMELKSRTSEKGREL